MQMEPTRLSGLPSCRRGAWLICDASKESRHLGATMSAEGLAMSIPGVLAYLVSVSVGIAAALVIRRIYARGSARVRTGLAVGVFLALGVAALILIV